MSQMFRSWAIAKGPTGYVMAEMIGTMLDSFTLRWVAMASLGAGLSAAKPSPTCVCELWFCSMICHMLTEPDPAKLEAQTPQKNNPDYAASCSMPCSISTFVANMPAWEVGVQIVCQLSEHIDKTWCILTRTAPSPLTQTDPERLTLYWGNGQCICMVTPTKQVILLLTSSIFWPATPAVLKFHTGPTDSWMTTSLPWAKLTNVVNGTVSSVENMTNCLKSSAESADCTLCFALLSKQRQLLWRFTACHSSQIGVEAGWEGVRGGRVQKTAACSRHWEQLYWPVKDSLQLHGTVLHQVLAYLSR